MTLSPLLSVTHTAFQVIGNETFPFTNCPEVGDVKIFAAMTGGVLSRLKTDEVVVEKFPDASYARILTLYCVPELSAEISQL